MSPLTGMLSAPSTRFSSLPLICVSAMSVIMSEHSERMRLSIWEIRTVRWSEVAQVPASSAK